LRAAHRIKINAQFFSPSVNLFSRAVFNPSKGKHMKTFTLLFLFISGSASLAHAELKNPEEQVIGIGVQIELTSSGSFLIEQVLDRSPAQNAGLLSGDVIEEIQSSPNTSLVSLTGMTLAEAVNLIRGPLGVSEIVVVKRGDAEFSFSIQREPIAQ
jgi:S1-C subfamily serine protease